tara:strand:- start:1168 stop:1935 length:768 start_codon:yes stop_codon:yes gene_type:complete
MHLGDPKNKQRNRFWLAITLTLGLHAATLLVLWIQPLHGTSAPQTNFVEVAVGQWSEVDTPVERTLEEFLSQRMESEVANLRSDASKSVSTERRSSGANQDEQQMAADVEAELRALEDAEFARLGAEQKDFGLKAVPDDGQRENIQTYEEWDSRYDGQVTVAFDVPGREELQLDMPGYRCRGGGVVVVMVEVTSAGGVRNVSLQGAKVSDAPDHSESVLACLIDEALRSARRSTFRASTDGPVSGTLTYRFIAQQ